MIDWVRRNGSSPPEECLEDMGGAYCTRRLCHFLVYLYTHTPTIISTKTPSYYKSRPTLTQQHRFNTANSSALKSRLERVWLTSRFERLRLRVLVRKRERAHTSKQASTEKTPITSLIANKHPLPCYLLALSRHILPPSYNWNTDTASHNPLLLRRRHECALHPRPVYTGFHHQLAHRYPCAVQR